MSIVEKNYSYVEFMKSVGRNSSTIQAEKMLSEIYMDLFLNRIHRKQTQERLMKLINQSLDNKDKLAFLKYSKQLAKFEDTN